MKPDITIRIADKWMEELSHEKLALQQIFRLRIRIMGHEMAPDFSKQTIFEELPE